MRCDGHPHSPGTSSPCGDPELGKHLLMWEVERRNGKLLPAGMGYMVVGLVPVRGWGHELPPSAR